MTYLIQAFGNANSKEVIIETKTNDKDIMEVVRQKCLALGLRPVVTATQEG